MNKQPVCILLAEDDDGHAALVRRNLRRGGVENEIVRFADGQETLDFFFGEDAAPTPESGTPYVLLLDVRMPKVDGTEVLRRLKSDGRLRRLPVFMLTTTDDPQTIQQCHDLGCSNYIVKPVEYTNFVEAVRRLGLFLMIVACPVLDERND